MAYFSAFNELFFKHASKCYKSICVYYLHAYFLYLYSISLDALGDLNSCIVFTIRKHFIQLAL